MKLIKTWRASVRELLNGKQLNPLSVKFFSWERNLSLQLSVWIDTLAFIWIIFFEQTKQNFNWGNRNLIFLLVKIMWHVAIVLIKPGREQMWQRRSFVCSLDYFWRAVTWIIVDSRSHKEVITIALIKLSAI